MSDDFDVDRNGVVTNSYTVYRGGTFKLTGFSHSIHLWEGTTDRCTHVVKDATCPLTFDEDLTVKHVAPLKPYQLGTDPANDGKAPDSNQNRQPVGAPLTSNGTLTVGTPTPDDDEEGGGRGQGRGRG